jgi:hypothetical protein
VYSSVIFSWPLFGVRGEASGVKESSGGEGIQVNLRPSMEG